jgi:hypothetical protein
MIIPSKLGLRLDTPYAESGEKSSIIENFPKQMENEASHIRFHDIVTVRESIHINDLSQEEIQSCWYSKHEYNQIKEEIRLTVASIQSGRYEGETDKDSLRGLECRLQKNLQRRKRVKMYGMMVVLGEQEEQEMTGTSDPNAIAQAYFSVTQQCVALAHRIALSDEAVAYEYQYVDTNVNKARKVKSIKQIITSRLLWRGKRQHKDQSKK